MNRIRTVLGGVALLAAAVVAGPVPAAAQNGVLHEVTEAMKITEDGRFARRVATAALFGSVDAGTPVCPQWLASYLGISKCSVVATASDSVSLTTGRGPIDGNFAVVVQDTNVVDEAEFVILRGRIHGRIDLSPAILGPDGKPGTGDELPLGTMRGTWSARGERGGPLDGLRERGSLTGVFRLPFELQAGQPLYMLDPAAFPGPGFAVPVKPEEHSLGAPTVRLEINFVD